MHETAARIVLNLFLNFENFEPRFFWNYPSYEKKILRLSWIFIFRLIKRKRGPYLSYSGSNTGKKRPYLYLIYISSVFYRPSPKFILYKILGMVEFLSHRNLYCIEILDFLSNSIESSNVSLDSEVWTIIKAESSDNW